MSPEAQRIAIAEACGWEAIHGDGDRDGTLVGYPTAPAFSREMRDVPNYSSDLNAMHEAEKVLTKSDDWLQYCTQLHLKICDDADEPMNSDPETLWSLLHATAAQRAEAFLRTIGKWVDDAPFDQSGYKNPDGH